MNETLKTELDKVCAAVAAKHSTTDKLVALMIQVQLVVTKLGVIATFAHSKHINVQESIGTLNTEVTNLTIIAGAMAGLEDAGKLMEIYADVNNRVQPLLSTYYGAAAGKGGN